VKPLNGFVMLASRAKLQWREIAEKEIEWIAAQRKENG
jgi:hypothetical protein